MIFKYDIYLSFAEKDNQILSERDSTWVSNFQKFLETLLSQLLGEKPKIIRSNEVTDPAFDPIKECCTLLCVVSPEYITSETVQRDLSFLSNFNEEEKNVLKIASLPRVFKVVKSYVPIENHPLPIRGLNSYDLFYYDTFTGVMKEFSAFFGQEAEKAYWTRLVDLSYDVYKILAYNHSKQTVSTQKAKVNHVVYLASTGKELSVQRDLIRIDLVRHGYKVLPEEPASLDVPGAADKIKKDISTSDYCIQLIGESFANDADNELMLLENQLISENKAVPNTTKNRVLNRLVWIPVDLKFQNEKQKNKFDAFRLDSDSLKGADVLQIPLEDFKTILRKRLNNTESEAQHLLNVGLDHNGTGKSVYLMVDKMDYEQAKPLITKFKEDGLQVMLPLYEGDLLEVRSKHQANLNACDAVMVFYGNVSEQWLRSKVLDVMKAPGFGRKKPFATKAVLMKEEAVLAENYYTGNQFTLIKTNGDIRNGALQSLVEKIKEVQ